MRLLNRLGNGIGLIALTASFALASPGVKVVHAQTLATQEAPAQCHAAAERQHSKDKELAAFLDRLRSQQPQRARGERLNIVVLNNRGYNYDRARIELDDVLAEADARR
jgi:hypothetical protein